MLPVISTALEIVGISSMGVSVRQMKQKTFAVCSLAQYV
jgi:hypothetical protein